METFLNEVTIQRVLIFNIVALAIGYYFILKPLKLLYKFKKNRSHAKNDEHT